MVEVDSSKFALWGNVINLLDELLPNRRLKRLREDRGEAIERSKALQQELLRNYDAPLLPQRFPALSAHYDSLPVESRETFSREVMARAIFEPDHFRFIARIAHPLARQAQAAAAFARGDLPDAADIFATLESTEFNVLCRARTLEAIGNFATAEEILRQRIDRNELFIVMELATLYAQHGKFAAANELLERVTEHFKDEQQAIQPLQHEIDAAIARGAMEKETADDIYTEAFVVDNWWFYLWTYSTFNEFQHGNMALDSGIRRQVTRLLKDTLPQTKTFIDFGAFCGFTIAKLKRFPPDLKSAGFPKG
jgi:tetratricopeptide (TPR) repeat protein